MQAGREGGGDPHDQAEIYVLGIFPSRRVLQGLDGPHGIFGSPVCKLLGSALPEADEPSPECEYEENPEGGEEGDDEVEGKVKDVFRRLGGGEGPADNPDGDEEGEAVEEGSE